MSYDLKSITYLSTVTMCTQLSCMQFQQSFCQCVGMTDANSVCVKHGTTLKQDQACSSIHKTRECNALWGEPERAIEVCSRCSSTVEDGALSLSLRRTQPFAGQNSVIRVRMEVYANCELYRFGPHLVSLEISCPAGNNLRKNSVR